MERLDCYLNKKYKCLPRECKIAFISALLFGFLAHNYMFTNKLPNYDDMGVTGFGATFRLGRWFLWVLGATAYHLDFSYSLPWINGVVSIVLLAISTALLVYTLQIESKVSIVLLSGLLIVFPSWTATFFFMFTAPYYAFAVLLGIIGVYCTERYTYGYIWGVICIVLSLGIYQAYFPFIASLFVLALVRKLLIDQEEINDIIINSFKYLSILVGAILIYGIVTKITLIVTGQELASYRGLNDIATFKLEKLYSSLRGILSSFSALCLSNDFELSYNILLKVCYLVSFLLWFVEDIICVLYLIKKSKKKESIWFIILNLALYISINGIFIMCPEENAIYLLMRYAYVLIPIYPLVLIDYCFRGFWNEKKIIICENICIGIALIMCCTYCHFSNAQYLSMDLSLKQAIGFYLPIVSQVKSMPEFNDETEVIFVLNEQRKIADETMYRNDVMRLFDVTGRDSVLSESGACQYLLSVYCGFAPKSFAFIRGIDDLGISEVAEMPVYPENGSMQMIDGKIIVKLSE